MCIRSHACPSIGWSVGLSVYCANVKTAKNYVRVQTSGKFNKSKWFITIFFISLIRSFFFKIRDSWWIVINFLHGKAFDCTVYLGEVKRKDAKLIDF